MNRQKKKKLNADSFSRGAQPFFGCKLLSKVEKIDRINRPIAKSVQVNCETVQEKMFFKYFISHHFIDPR